MPGFDRTGPMGAGPMTGGARGLCHPAGARFESGYRGTFPDGRRLGFRRGFAGGGGFGMGRGRGFARSYGLEYGGGYGWAPPAAGPYATPQPADELSALKAEADYLQKSLAAIRRRIDELQGAGTAPAEPER